MVPTGHAGHWFPSTPVLWPGVGGGGPPSEFQLPDLGLGCQASGPSSKLSDAAPGSRLPSRSPGSREKPLSCAGWAPSCWQHLNSANQMRPPRTPNPRDISKDGKHGCHGNSSWAAQLAGQTDPEMVPGVPAIHAHSLPTTRGGWSWFP